MPGVTYQSAQSIVEKDFSGSYENAYYCVMNEDYQRLPLYVFYCSANDNLDLKFSMNNKYKTTCYVITD